METEIFIPEKIKEESNRNNLENITKKVSIMKDALYEEMKSYGITPSVAERIFIGEEIILCFNCGTPNMYNTLHVTSRNKRVYKCDKCNEIYFK